MRSNTARVVIGIAAVAAAVLLFLVLQDDGDDGGGDGATTTREAGSGPAGGGTSDGTAATTEEKPPPGEVIVVKDGKPVGGVKEIEYRMGDTVRFAVRSNEADEIHVHGYDVERPVPANGVAFFVFPADIEGIFEVELHHGETQIAELRVTP